MPLSRPSFRYVLVSLEQLASTVDESTYNMFVSYNMFVCRRNEEKNGYRIPLLEPFYCGVDESIFVSRSDRRQINTTSYYNYKLGRCNAIRTAWTATHEFASLSLVGQVRPIGRDFFFRLAPKTSFDVRRRRDIRIPTEPCSALTSTLNKNPDRSKTAYTLL